VPSRRPCSNRTALADALQVLDQGIDRIHEFLDEYDLNDKEEGCQELQNLEGVARRNPLRERLGAGIRTNRPDRGAAGGSFVKRSRTKPLKKRPHYATRYDGSPSSHRQIRSGQPAKPLAQVAKILNTV
jgi:hypothetical protein